MNLTSDSLSVIAHPPRLTVVICTYNNADVLAQTLAHLEAQCTDERL
jgi:glycosyltransferase involved in cell wall biosynthesis